MATRKRASSRSGIVGRAVSAGRRALREAEKRVPPDVRRQVERRLKDADKTARAAIKQLQAQARKASTRADVNSVLKRIDGLTKQARQIARGTGARATTTRRRAASTTRRATTRTRKAASTTRRKPASTRKAAASGSTTRPATRRAPARRRRTAPAEETLMVTPVAEMGEVEIIEVIEP
jgi:hypothetical protein